MAPASDGRRAAFVRAAPLGAAALLAAALLAGCGARTGVDDVDAGRCSVDLDCSDGLACTGEERCVERSCVAGVPLDCDDGDPCTEDACREPGDAGAARCENRDLRVDGDGDGYDRLAPELDPSCGDDCNDDDPLVNPGADEVCNGIDDDCDGAVDEGVSFEPSGEEHRLTFDGVASGHGGLQWNPVSETWGAIEWDYRGGSADIYFYQLDEAGRPVAEPTLLTLDPGDAFGAPMVWTGREYAIAWEDRRHGQYEVYFNRLSPEGDKLAPDYRVTHADGWSISPSLLWTGHEYALAWQDARDDVDTMGNFELYMAFLDEHGWKIGDDIRLTYDPAASEDPVMALGPDELGIVFVDSREGTPQIYFLITDLTGRVVAAERRISGGRAPTRRPSIAWVGDSFLAAWQVESPAGDADIEATRIPRQPPGPIAEPVALLSGRSWSRAPGLLPDAGDVILQFSDDRAGSYDVYVARFDSRLGRLSADIRVTHGPRDSVFGTIGRGPTSIGVLFNDQRDGNWEVYFTRLLCVDP